MNYKCTGYGENEVNETPVCLRRSRSRAAQLSERHATRVDDVFQPGVDEIC